MRNTKLNSTRNRTRACFFVRNFSSSCINPSMTQFLLATFGRQFYRFALLQVEKTILVKLRLTHSESRDSVGVRVQFSNSCLVPNLDLVQTGGRFDFAVRICCIHLSQSKILTYKGCFCHNKLRFRTEIFERDSMIKTEQSRQLISAKDPLEFVFPSKVKNTFHLLKYSIIQSARLYPFLRHRHTHK